MPEPIPAQEITQQESLNFLRIIRNELMMQNGFSESANQDRKDLLVAEEQIKQQMIDDAAAKAKADAEAAKQALANRSIVTKTNDFLKKMLGNSDWVKENTLRMQKAAKAAMSKIDPSKYMKALGDKTAKFASDILKLLLTGGILWGLWKLFEWLAEQDPVALYNKAKEALTQFITEYEAWIAGIARLAAIAAVWKAAEFLTFGKGPLWVLWNSIKAIFAVGGLFTGLSLAVGKWASHLMFGEDAPLKKLWRGIKWVFGVGGMIAKLVGIVTGWAITEMFDLTKSSLVKVWNGIKTIFGAEGKIGKFLIDVVDKIKLFTGFGPEGPFTKMWTSIKNFFGLGGKLAKSPGFLLTAEEMIDLKKIGLDEKGPFKTMWTAIKGIFGAEGKIASFIKTVSPFPAWFDEGSKVREMFKFLKNVFGAEGKIAKGLAAIADAEDFVGFGSDMQKMMRWLKGFFGADGKLANGWKRIKNLIPDFTGEKGIMTKVFNGVKGLFGPDSAVGRLGAKLSEWGEKFKKFFTFGEAAEDVGGKKGGSAIARFFNFIGGIFGKIGGFVKAIVNNPVVKGALTFIKAGGSFLAKIFAPIGWIMGFVAAVVGFWDGFKSKGKDDDRSFAQKIMDGLKGALKGLIDFIVIDTVMMIQDIMNWALGYVNKIGSWIPLFKPFKEFTFGDDIKVATEKWVDSLGGDSGFGSGKEVVPLEEKASAPVENPLTQLSMLEQNTNNTQQNYQNSTTEDKKMKDAADSVPG
tara:strand:+ start:1388 stop:3625 length:2238 start_codon:yes stop_codon:yes gene_type:complete